MDCEVAVAGAGPAGAVAALVAARSGRRVVLLDDPRPARRRIGESLPGAARPLLRDLGLLPLVEAGHEPCVGNLSAWGSRELVATDALRDPHGPGWHLDRPRFDDDLRRHAAAAGAVSRRGRVRTVEAVDGGWRIGFGGGATDLTARWVIDATGRHAAVARRLGVVRHRDDGLVAIHAWAAPRAGDRDRRTLVESAPDGWWYTARLPDGHRVVALHVDGEEAVAMLRTPEGWHERLASTVHVAAAVAGARFPTGPRATDAGGARLERFAGQGWLAAGDAALSFDPLSSQGLFHALFTGLRAAEAVDAALGGEPAAVAAYAARLESVRVAYLDHHRAHYRAEGRWPERSFWSRRGGRVGAIGKAGS